MSDAFYVKFWGVRGTIPTPDLSMMRYGGHTSCIEVRCGNLTFSLDAGTGIIPFMNQCKLKQIHLLLSHTHIDHIMGLCAMRKMFDYNFSMNVWAGHLIPELSLQNTLEKLLSPPLFPIALSAMPSKLSFHDFKAGISLNHEDFKKNKVRITTLPLNHPDRATAYRIDYMEKSICYVTDVEHIKDTLDEQLLSFAANSDLFIYDSTYDENEFLSHKGWGHSTWQHAIKLGEKAGVGEVVLFHHDSSTTDKILDMRASYIKDNYIQKVIIASEGLIWTA